MRAHEDFFSLKKEAFLVGNTSEVAISDGYLFY